MRPKAVRILISLVLTASFLAAVPAVAQTAKKPGIVPGQKLHQFFAAEWEYTMQQNPVFASLLGDRRFNDRWEDTSIAAIQAQQQHAQQALKRLQQINRAQLSREDQLSYDLFKNKLDTAIEGFQFKDYLAPIDQRGGLQTLDQLADQLRFTTVKDYEDWIARLRALPAYTDQTIALLRGGIKERVLQPKIIMQRIPAQLEKQVVDDPKKSGFYKPFTKFPKDFSEADKQRLAAAGEQAVADAVVPSFRKLKQVFDAEYLPASFDQVGVWQQPNGGKAYAYYARQYTTTDLTPEEIHALGLKEVARINAEMEKVIQEVGFKGTREEFFNYLRTDPKFFYKTGEEILEGTRAMSKRIDPNLVKVFRTLPRTPYGVEPIPAAIAPDTTTAYYSGPAADGSRPGTYYVNLYKPESRPKWEMLALALHEAVPGHHLQIALSRELSGDIPNFRKYSGYTAFSEGWGLYAESLGYDMGLYDDPYSRFGQLTYEMWRAVRLVVDTGMHHKRWMREQAIDFFKKNAPKAELDIVNEIDRYIAWPGQALAYKIGELKLTELRRRAAQELGAKFDIKEFHDVVLLQGAMPLNVLEQRVDGWIAEKKQRAELTPKK
ncbi:MAG: DUF885 domain-containing protein [Acidobacteriales bacterium]|nr:DUF885 domain-containing protein [Terriglobales bacterium]